MADLTDNGDMCAWAYGGISPVIEADRLVAIDVQDRLGRVRLRVPWEDVIKTALEGLSCEFIDVFGRGHITTTTGEAVSYERDECFPRCH